MAAIAAAVAELRAEIKDRFDTAFIIRRRPDGWQLTEVLQDRTWRSHWATLAEAIEQVHLLQAQAAEARWECGWEAAAEAAANRYWEEGTSAFQMQYQAELDAEYAAGALDPEFSAGYWPA